MDNSLLSIFLLISVSMTSPMPIVIVNLGFQISPKKDGKFSATFAIVMILLLNLQSKIVSSLFDAPTFTKRRPIANYLILPFILR